MGALRPPKAEVDAALAHGYAEGLEEARADALDSFRTVLSQMLELRFGPLPDSALDCIGEADQITLEKWVVQTAAVSSLDELFRE
jgi:hypothetical protein